MDDLFHILNNSTFEYYFTLLWLVLFPFIIFVVITFTYFKVKKYMPFSSKNCPVDVNQKAEKTFVAAGALDRFGFRGSFFTIYFHSDFMLIRLLGRFLIVSYSEDITIKEGIFYSEFYFKIDNLKYTIIPYSKEAIEYLKMKLGKV